MLYQSLKLTNGIWVLAELRIQPGNPNFMVRPPPPPGLGAALMGNTLAQLGWSSFEPGANKHQNSVPIKDLRKLSTLSHHVAQIKHQTRSQNSKLN